MLYLLALACLDSKSEVMLSGRVRSNQDDGSPATGVDVSSIDPELAVYGEAQTNDGGHFEVAVVANGVFHVHFSKAGFTTTSFSGVVGSRDFSLGEDYFFLRSDEEVAALRALHQNCSSSEIDGGIVEGIVQLPLQSDTTGSYTIAKDARVTATVNGGVTYNACYLDDDGLSDESGDRVGSTGRFAIFGLDEGAIELEFQQDIGNSTISNYAFAYMPTNGIVPLFSIFLDLP